MSYAIEELTIKEGGEEELKRLEIIFCDLLKKEITGDKLTEHEKEFFCMAGIKLSLIKGTLDDYSCCANFKFIDIYLSYWYDLSGQGFYTKMKKGIEYIPSKLEIDCDIKYLNKQGYLWESIIAKTNHSEKLLQEISKETRNELKQLKESTGRIYFRRQEYENKINKLKVLLQSKNIYCRSLLILEKFENNNLELSLNGQLIVIDEFSIIHILSRHYAEMTKFKSNKSFHNENFEPNYLNVQLADIFKEIDYSGFYKDQEINKITFTFNATIYQIWINKRIKQVKEEGNIVFNRLETFYPIENQEELDSINSNFDLKEINDKISIYIKKKADNTLYQ